MSRYVVIDNIDERAATFENKDKLVKYLNELVEEHEEELPYNVEVYTLGEPIHLEVKPRTVVINEVKVTTKKKTR